MAGRRYEISLRVFRNPSNIFFNTRREISYFQAVMKCSVYYINTNEIPNHFTLIFVDFLCKHSNGDLFTNEGNMFFTHEEFSRKTSPAILLVFR